MEFEGDDVVAVGSMTSGHEIALAIVITIFLAAWLLGKFLTKGQARGSLFDGDE